MPDAENVTVGRTNQEQDRMSESRLKRERMIARLETRIAALEEQVRQRDATIGEQSKQLDEAADFLEKLPDVDALTKQNNDYKLAIQEGQTRAVWEEAAAKAGVDPEYFDDLWKLDPPELSDAPDPKQIATHLAKSVEGRKVFLSNDQVDDDEPETDDQADDEEEGGIGGRRTESDGTVTIFDLAPPKAAAKAQGKNGEAQPANGKTQPKMTEAKPQAGPNKLNPGLGAGRGGRDSQKVETILDKVNSEFASTGRTDDFRI